MENEKYNVKYMNELEEYFSAYGKALISEIFVGVSVNLGMSEKEAYRIAKNRPGELRKAFFESIFDKFKSIFKWKVPRFRFDGFRLFSKQSKPMTDEQWTIFNESVSKYWQSHMNKVAEDIGVKSYMLGRQSTEYKRKKKPYKTNTLKKVVSEQWPNGMPDSIEKAYKNFKDNDKKNQNRIQSNIAMYVTNAGDDLKSAIRQQVVSGIADNKSPQEIASDLYWNIEKGKNNNYTAESIHRNWYRVAVTETAMAYQSGMLSPYEDQAMESLKDPTKAVYVVRVGGTCDWCRSVRGKVMRLIPSEIANPSTNSLADIGIEDRVTDIYTYNGQNNVGRKQKDWFPTAPAHPHNKAELVPFNPKDQYYDKKNDTIRTSQEKSKYIPQLDDPYSVSKEEKEAKKPKKVSDNKVTFNGNLYEAVSAEEYNKRLEAHKKDSSLPIPINISSPSYKRIFGAAK